MKIRISSKLKLEKGISKVSKIKKAASDIYDANEVALEEQGISKDQFINRITSDVRASKSYSVKSLKENIRVYNNILNLGNKSGLSWSEMDDEMRRALMNTEAPIKKPGNRYRDYITGKFMSKKDWQKKWGDKKVVEVEGKTARLLDDETGELFTVPISELDKFSVNPENTGFDYATAEYVGYGSDGPHENYEILEDANGNRVRHYYSRGAIVPYE